MYWAMVRLGTPALWHLLRMYVGHCAAQRRTARKLWRAVRDAPTAAEAPLLRPITEHLHEFEHAALGLQPGASPTTQGERITVVHILGSGEVLYSPLPGLRALLRTAPALAQHRHVVMDTPHHPAAYLGPMEFASRAFQALRPLLEAPERGPLLLVGLSRGAVAAVELAFRAAERTGQPTAALCLSAPTRGDIEWPASVRDIGLLEAGADAALRLPLPGFLRRFRRARFRHAYARVTAGVYNELSLDNEEMLALLARHIRETSPERTCLRALREYALLGRVSDAELRQGFSDFAARAASEDLVRLTFCWGTQDVWMPHARCRQRVEESLNRHPGADARVTLHSLPGWNHGIARQPEQDFGPVAALMTSACNWLQQPSQKCEGSGSDDG